MKILYFITIFVHNIHGKLSEVERIEFCNNLECDETENKTVCGLRKENGRNVFKLFFNECQLLKYGCFDSDSAYGITNIERCNTKSYQENNRKHCPDCRLIEKEPVCGIRKDGEGFIVRLFTSECHLYQYNCEQKQQFTVTDLYICGKDMRRAMLNKIESTTDIKIPNDIDDRDDKLVDEAISELGETIVTAQTINSIDNIGETTIENQTTSISRSENTIVTQQNKNDVGEVDETTITDETTNGLEEYGEIKTVEQTINIIGETKLSDQTVDAGELSEIITTDHDTINDISELVDINITEPTNQTLNDTRETISDQAFNDIVENITIADEIQKKNATHKNIVVIHGSMADMLRINQTVENFFAATHVLDLPMKEVQPTTYENTRRRLIRIFGPIKVFTPWLKIPENITEDHHHKPTLSSCFHKCPTKCPDTYAPVCGVPGIVAREPSLMFQNHCFMDVAQCKMFWEDKSWTAESSAYIESSFLFCLGDELNGLYRFLPLIRTLQHMGRLKNKGRYHYKLTNMRFFNQLLSGQPNVMGR